MTRKKGIAILGSTGSVGKQALDVITSFPELFQVSVLTANNNYQLLIEQAKKFRPNTVVIGNEDFFKQVVDELFPLDIKVFAGADAMNQVLDMAEIDTVVNALLGFSGLKPTINAIKAGKSLALANKESLVIAGDLIKKLYTEHKCNIIPVDSEHSAIYQCIVGEFNNPVEKVILTASGGPFYQKKQGQIKNISVQEALDHPVWNMGDKITIDSATLINKGFEVIEARWLYDLDFHQIEVIIHPQSVIHSFVQFADGSMKAQLSEPDMRIPIQYALSFPERLRNEYKRVDPLGYGAFTFQDINLEAFPNLKLAYEAMKKGGNAPCMLNAGNEIAVKAFLENQIGFQDIFKINESCLNKIPFVPEPDLEAYLDTDRETRKLATSLIS